MCRWLNPSAFIGASAPSIRRLACFSCGRILLAIDHLIADAIARLAARATFPALAIAAILRSTLITNWPWNCPIVRNCDENMSDIGDWLAEHSQFEVSGDFLSALQVIKFRQSDGILYAISRTASGKRGRLSQTL